MKLNVSREDKYHGLVGNFRSEIARVQLRSVWYSVCCIHTVCLIANFRLRVIILISGTVHVYMLKFVMFMTFAATVAVAVAVEQIVLIVLDI